jgi:putative ABC transport system permease protein
MVGFDLDDTIFIPVAQSMKIFNMEEVTEIDTVFNPSYQVAEVEAAIRQLVTSRHGGKDDVTIMSQQAMLETFDNVMNLITAGVAAIGGISLVVGAVGILTMMWIAVGERTREIGLMRSIGATPRQVRFVFLAEAGTLATLGGAVGLIGALGLCQVLRDLAPGLPVDTPVSFAALAVLVSLATGLVSGVLPAQRAASLDPIEALRAE